MDDNELLKNRFNELSNRAYQSGRSVYTDFLSMAEQALLRSLRLPGSQYELWGGAEGCERQLARFSGGDDGDWPIACLMISPRSKKFSGELSHRDFLGALLSLGIERSTIGDIIARDNSAYVFCAEKIVPFIIDNLIEAKRASVSVSMLDAAPDGPLYILAEDIVQVSSERIDGVVARAYGLSRDDSLELFRHGRVFINSAACENNSRPLKEGDIVSVRGFGRFVYRGLVRVSKKGKLNVKIEKYE